MFNKLEPTDSFINFKGTVMKKLLSITLLLSLLQAQELTPSQISKIGNYSHSISGKLHYQQRLKKIATIKQRQAYAIAHSFCRGKITSSKIKYHASRIFYVVSTQNCMVKIDALDGSIMERK